MRYAGRCRGQSRDRIGGQPRHAVRPEIYFLVGTRNRSFGLGRFRPALSYDEDLMMKNRIRFIVVAFALVGTLLPPPTAFTQEPAQKGPVEKPAEKKEARRERTIDEIKVEAVRRAEVGQYPLIGLDPADVKEAFTSIHTSDKDEWAAGFMHVADRYFDEAKSLEKSTSPDKTDLAKANADYVRAWRLYSFGRWP